MKQRKPTFLADWAKRNFGSSHATEIAAILDEYYRLNFPAKPEHLHLAPSRRITMRSTATAALRTAYETDRRLLEALPRERKDAFYETVVYPVHGFGAGNQMHLSVSAEAAQKAYARFRERHGITTSRSRVEKWRHMISSNPRNRPACASRMRRVCAKADARSDSGAIATVTFLWKPSSPRALSAVRNGVESHPRSRSFRRFHRAPAHDDCSGTRQRWNTISKSRKLVLSKCCLLPANPTDFIRAEGRYSVSIGSGEPRW